MTTLALCLMVAGAALAQWSRLRPGTAPPAALVAPVQSQDNFSPAHPSKEYIYTGSRLVATEESAALADQTITFDQPSDRTYGAAPFALDATSSSGLPINFTLLSGPASLSGNTLTIAGAGTVTLRADQAGNSGFRPAQSVTRALTVAKAAATIALSNLTQTYIAAPKPATAMTTPAGLSGLTLTYDGATSAPTAAGTYAVSAALDNSNYNAPAVAAPLVIRKATAAVTLGNLTGQIYTGTAKAATATTTPAGLAVSLAYSQDGTTVSSPVNAGNYSVLATLNDANYDGSVSGTLVIAKATATLSLGNMGTQIYNGTPKPATATISPEGLSGVSITYNGSIDAPVNAGTYSVVAALDHLNYTAANATGTLVINKATATLTSGNLTGQIYDGTPKSVTVTSAPAGLSAVSVTYNGSATAPTNAGNYSVAANLDNPNYAAATATGVLFINKATPIISWNNPADIAEDTALGSTQLNATANVAGIFLYSPPAGTLLNPGAQQQLSASFTPTDGVNYTTVARSVRINVVGCPKAARSTFSPDHPLAAAGTPLHLYWNIPYATTVTISGISGTFAASGNTPITVNATTTYTLTATGSNLCAPLTMTTTVTVGVCPDSASATFTASTYTVSENTPVTLNWSVPQATGILITFSNPCVPGGYVPCIQNWQVIDSPQATGSVQVYPSPSSSYSLAATNAPYGCTEVNKTIFFNNADNPDTDPNGCGVGYEFSATPSSTSTGQVVTLHWTMPSGPRSISTTDTTGESYEVFLRSGSIQVTPQSTTTYVLTPSTGKQTNPACASFTLRTTVTIGAVSGLNGSQRWRQALDRQFSLTGLLLKGTVGSYRITSD